MLLAGRFKCPSPANPGNKTPFGASVFMHQLLCAWAFVRVLNWPGKIRRSPGRASRGVARDPGSWFRRPPREPLRATEPENSAVFKPPSA